MKLKSMLVLQVNGTQIPLVFEMNSYDTSSVHAHIGQIICVAEYVKLSPCMRALMFVN